MEKDELSSLIAKGVAGALFEISHQNYPAAARLVANIKELARKHNRPVSIIQDLSEMQDPLDLHFGMRTGVHWVASHDANHLKIAKGLSKLAGLIYKGRNLPKDVKVDSVMADNFMDPDAEIAGIGQVKHLTVEHKNQALLDSLLHMAKNSDASGIVVSDIDLAKALAFRRSGKKIILAPKNNSEAEKASIYPGIHPLFVSKDLASNLLYSKAIDPNERVLDARDIKHVAINMVK